MTVPTTTTFSLKDGKVSALTQVCPYNVLQSSSNISIGILKNATSFAHKKEGSNVTDIDIK